MLSYPIPGSRYVGGYIGVGLQKQDTEIITLSYSDNTPSSKRNFVFKTLGCQPNMVQIG